MIFITIKSTAKPVVNQKKANIQDNGMEKKAEQYKFLILNAKTVQFNWYKAINEIKLPQHSF